MTAMKRLFLLAACLLAFSAQGFAAQEIRIGVLSDLSGATSDVGKPYAEGIMDCVKWLNEVAYVPGHSITALQVDYAYNAQQAITAYKKFVSSDHIVALQGWGTQDTEALTGFVAKDRIPTLSASYSAHLTDPKKSPYNFFIAADYSTQLRGALKFFKDSWKESRPPKLALVYPNHPYGLAPIPAGKDYAKEIGYDLVGEENVDLKALDATPQLLALKGKAPDFVWVGGTTASTAVILKDAKKLGLGATFITNIWGSDESLPKLAGEAAEGAYSLQTSVVYGADVPGMEIIKKITNGEPQMIHYIRGFASMLTMAEGLKLAAAAGKLDGPGIKAALETLRDFDPLGLTPPVSFFPDDHRPNMTAFLFKIEGGKLIKAGESTLPRKPEWLGK